MVNKCSLQKIYYIDILFMLKPPVLVIDYIWLYSVYMLICIQIWLYMILCIVQYYVYTYMMTVQHTASADYKIDCCLRSNWAPHRCDLLNCIQQLHLIYVNMLYGYISVRGDYYWIRWIKLYHICCSFLWVMAFKRYSLTGAQSSCTKDWQSEKSFFQMR